MKQAILITAYKDINSLIDIINFFDENFKFYIHIDKKSKLDFSILHDFKNVFVYDNYIVNWGGVNHLKAILLLVNEALKDEKNIFFHLITGEDFPTKTLNDFRNLDFTKNYIDYFDVPAVCWKSENGGLDRLKYYRLYDTFNTKTPIQSFIISSIFHLQKISKIERSFSQCFPKKLYGGSTYWSLNRNALQCVTDYTAEHKWLLKRFNHTFCPEEIYFQTILLNSSHSSNIINNNLRFIDWLSGRDGYPSYLDESDFDNIIQSKNFFARKIRNFQSLKNLLTIHFQHQV